MELTELTLSVNGEVHHLYVPADLSLLDLLRDRLHLYGAREGCGIGMCGACTVLLNGRAVSSCLLLTVQADGGEVTTVEGLARDGELHPVQEAYLEQAAFQCAYCTPGFILATVALLEEGGELDDQAIRTYLSGNLCRCGSYANILAAVKSALQRQG